MQSKAVLQSLIERILKCDFKYVYHALNGQDGINLEPVMALKLLAAICNVCHSNLNTPSHIKDSDLQLLCLKVNGFLQAPLEAKYETYLQCVFYIISFLQEKNSFETMLEFQELLLPKCKPGNLTDQHKKIEETLCKSIHNSILKVSVLPPDKRSNLTLALSKLLIQMRVNCGRDAAVLDTLHNSAILLQSCASKPQIYDLYSTALGLLPDDVPDTFYVTLISSFSLVYTSLLTPDSLQLAHQCYKRTVDKLQCFKGQEYVHLNGLLEVVRILNLESDLSYLSSVHNSLRLYHKKYGVAPNLEAVCEFITAFICAFIVLQKKQRTFDTVSEQQQLLLFNVLQNISKIFTLTSSKCSCKCLTDTKILEALRILSAVLELSKLTILKKGNVTRLYKKEMLRYSDQCIKLLRILKQNGCTKLDKSWYALGSFLYAIGNECATLDTEMSVQYLKKFVHTTFELEGQSLKVINPIYLKGALGKIADIYLSEKEYAKCMLATAIKVILVESPRNEIYPWVNAKAAIRETSEHSPLQELTLVTILTKYPEELQSYTSQSLEFDEGRLLMYELDSYKRVWKSKVSMMVVLKRLQEITECTVMAELLVDVLGDCTINVHESIPEIIHNVIKRYEATPLKSYTRLAHLYFLKHKYTMDYTITKHSTEIENTISSIPTETETNVNDPPHPNDKCDVFSSYEVLTMSRYLAAMHSLNKSLELSKAADVTDAGLHRVLCLIGHEYHLNFQLTNSREVWELALKVATLQKHPLNSLEALGFVLELAPLDERLKQHMVLVETGLEMVTGQETKLAIYFLCKASALLAVGETTNASEALTAAERYLRTCTSSHLTAYFYLLQHKFNSLPCRFGILNHADKSCVKIYEALREVVPSGGIFWKSAHELRILFEIHENIMQFYHDLRMPREVRCYGKQIVILAQKMVLPLRVLNFLYYLAYADINSSRFDDCRTKISGMNHILEISNVTSMDVEEVVKRVRNMRLNDPENLARCGSPVLKSEVFQAHPLMKHKNDCVCFYCGCSEYQVLVLKKTLIRALLYEHEDNVILAENFYHGGIKTCRSSKIKSDGGFIYCTILLNYGDMLQRQKKVVEAQKTNLEALQVFERSGLSYKSTQLYTELLFQQMNILSSDQMPSYSESESPEDTDVRRNIDFQEVMAASPGSAHFVKPAKVLRMKPKSLKLDFSDSEDEDKKVVSSKKNAVRREKGTPKVERLEMKTPVRMSARTRSARLALSEKLEGGGNERTPSVKKYARNRI